MLEIVGYWSGRGGDLQGRGSGSLGRGCSFGIGYELATILLQISFRMATIFATIGPRSGVDRHPITWRRFHDEISSIAA